jgi:hypothetical protein
MRSEMIGEERDVGTWCVSCWQIYIFLDGSHCEFLDNKSKVMVCVIVVQ